MHSNQRRVDEETEGGKWDFSPVDGARTLEGTEWDLIEEYVLPFDPCCATEMALLWFSPEGTPTLKNVSPSDEEVRHLKVTIWLFHLDKKEIAQERTAAVIDIFKDIKAADTAFKIWQQSRAATGSVLKTRFDDAIAKLKSETRETKPFARARQCAVLLSKAEYPWIGEYIPRDFRRLPSVYNFIFQLFSGDPKPVYNFILLSLNDLSLNILILRNRKYTTLFYKDNCYLYAIKGNRTSRSQKFSQAINATYLLPQYYLESSVRDGIMPNCGDMGE